MQGKDSTVMPKPLRSWQLPAIGNYACTEIRRSHTIGVSVVQRSDRNSEQTHVNIFVDGRADSSHVLQGTVSIGEALIWYGTQLKLKGE